MADKRQIKLSGVFKKKEEAVCFLLLDFYSPMQDVAPSAVSTAVAIDAMICTTNLKVSFFVIMVHV
jgi:hypothetical protein